MVNVQFIPCVGRDFLKKYIYCYEWKSRLKYDKKKFPWERKKIPNPTIQN